MLVFVAKMFNYGLPSWPQVTIHMVVHIMYTFSRLLLLSTLLVDIGWTWSMDNPHCSNVLIDSWESVCVF